VIRQTIALRAGDRQAENQVVRDMVHSPTQSHRESNPQLRIHNISHQARRIHRLQALTDYPFRDTHTLPRASTGVGLLGLASRQVLWRR
jgi:hypothetical protein